VDTPSPENQLSLCTPWNSLFQESQHPVAEVLAINRFGPWVDPLFRPSGPDREGWGRVRHSRHEWFGRQAAPRVLRQCQDSTRLNSFSIKPSAVLALSRHWPGHGLPDQRPQVRLQEPSWPCPNRCVSAAVTSKPLKSRAFSPCPAATRGRTPRNQRPIADA
jgi:hypothetical protein